MTYFEIIQKFIIRTGLEIEEAQKIVESAEEMFPAFFASLPFNIYIHDFDEQYYYESHWLMIYVGMSINYNRYTVFFM